MTANKIKPSPYGAVKFVSIDQYHASFPKPIQEILQKLRLTIQQAAPKAVETISYNMPCFKQNRNLVYYAAHKEHIGFYPTSKPLVFFKDALVSYKTSKGAIQFPLNKPLPIALIKKIVKFRVEEDNSTKIVVTKKAPKEPKGGLLTLLNAPARRALENAGIKTVKQVSKYSEKEILQLHGMGKSSIPILKDALDKAGLQFRD